MGIAPDAVGGAAVPARQDIAVAVKDADLRGVGVVQGRQLADDEVALRGFGDVGGAAGVRPHCDEVAHGVKDLDAAVFAVADIDAVVAGDQQAVGQVEFVGALLAGLAPGEFEVAVVVEAVDAGVAVAVGDEQVAAGGRHQFGGVVEGAGGAGHQGAGDLAAGVGVDAVAAQHLDGLAVQGVHQAHAGVAVGEIDDVVLDVEAVGIDEGAVAPAADEVAAAVVKDGDGRVGAVEHIDVVGGVAGQGADGAQGVGGGHFGPVGGEGVGVAAGAYGGHNGSSCGWLGRVGAWGMAGAAGLILTIPASAGVPK